MAKPPAKQNSVVIWLQALLIVLVGLWVYTPALRGDWIWDDFVNILNNPLHNDPARLWKIWFRPQDFLEYYPLNATVEYAQWVFWQTNTFGYHLVNLVLHLFSAFLVWRLLEKIGVRCAWIGGLLFAIHPVMVESVAWMVELKNTLSLPPLLLAMCVYLDYDQHRRPRVYFLAWFLFLIAMLCKASVMMLPFVVLLHAWWKRGRIDRHDLRAAAGFLVITLVLGAINLWTDHRAASLAGYMIPASSWHRFSVICLLALFYLWKAVVPIHLLPVYPIGIIPLHGWLTVLPCLLLGSLVVFAWMNRAIWGRHVLFGLGFYLINLGPVAAFMLKNYSTMIWSLDHLIYIPMIGLFGLVAAALGSIPRLHVISDQLLARAGVAIAVILLCVASHAQAAIYNTSEALWTYTIRYNPDAVPANNDLSLLALKDGHLDEAEFYARHTIELAPLSDGARLNYGNVLLKLGRASDAADQFTAALNLKPDNAFALNSLASCFAMTGHYTDALRASNKAVRLQPNSAGDLAARGEIKRSLGDWAGARADLDRAIEIDADAASAYISRGVIRQAEGDRTGALEDLRQFRQLAPTDHNADYAALWIWIIDRGQNHAADADRDLTSALAQGWNAAPTDPASRYALFLLGNTTDSAFLAATPDQPGRQCEARYYAGAKRLLAGDKAAAADDFRASLATGSKDFFEYTLAQAELSALAAPPKK